MPKLFVSYSRVDQTFVKDFAYRLRRIYDFDNVWYDDSIHGGQKWWDEILTRIETSDIFIYILSPESVESEYCLAEYTEALRLHKQILPVLVRDRTNIPPALKEIHYIDMKQGITVDSFTDLQAAIQRLQQQIPSTAPTPRSPKPTPVPSVKRADDVPQADPEQPATTKASASDTQVLTENTNSKGVMPIVLIVGVVVLLTVGIGGLILFANPFATDVPDEATIQPTIQVADDITPTVITSTAIVDTVIANVTADLANLRTGPGPEFSIATSVENGAELDVVGQYTIPSGSTWYFVNHPSGNLVWVWEESITLSPENAEVDVLRDIPTTFYVRNVPANLRDAPDPVANLVATVEDGDRRRYLVEASGFSPSGGLWYLIQYEDDLTAWVYTEAGDLTPLGADIPRVTLTPTE